MEYFARAAWDQYRLPYTIVRPFNCVGIGESRARQGLPVQSGNVSLAMTHVVPDLVQKILKGQDPLHILGDGHQVRHYTYAGDIARGIVMCMESPAAANEDFNISTSTPTTVRELAELIWLRLRPDGPPFRVRQRPPLPPRRAAPHPQRRQGPAPAGLRGHRDPRRDARRGHPVDPRSRGGGDDLRP